MERTTSPQPTPSAHRVRRRWLRMGLLVAFTPICVGQLIVGVVYHWAFLPAGALWSCAWGFVLRVAINDRRVRGTNQDNPRQQLAMVGWLLLAIVLIFAIA